MPEKQTVIQLLNAILSELEKANCKLDSIETAATRREEPVNEEERESGIVRKWLSEKND